jgi:predicted DNA-binding antitoxin AbrB/MazE fold protein
MAIRVVFKEGVFRPVETVELPDGTELEVEIRAVAEASESGADPVELARFLAKLAAMPLQPGGEVFSNQDHDRVLYGWKDKR